MTNKLKWSCDQKDRKNCRDPHGCHCREITDLLHQVDNLSKLNHTRAKALELLPDEQRRDLVHKAVYG